MTAPERGVPAVEDLVEGLREVLVVTVGEVALCAHRDASGVRPSDQELAGLELLDQRMQRVWPGDEAQEEELGGANLVHVMGRELVGHPVRIVAEVQLSAVLPIEQRHRAETVDGRHQRAAGRVHNGKATINPPEGGRIWPYPLQPPRQHARVLRLAVQGGAPPQAYATGGRPAADELEMERRRAHRPGSCVGRSDLAAVGSRPRRSSARKELISSRPL